jgi:CTP synthase
MRLGLYPAKLTPGSRAAEAYGQEVIYERHRHRFEVNNTYRATLEEAGMILSGQSPDGRLVEIVELRDHPWFVASQFHPEFKSRPERPHPLFDGFVKAALKDSTTREEHGAPTGAPAEEAQHAERIGSAEPAVSAESGTVAGSELAPETSTVPSAG